MVITQEDLVRQDFPHDLSGLGVLQIVDSLVAIGGKTAYRYFIHLSIQELLAAYHISQLKGDEQVKVFESLLNEPRFSAVLQFYAAFTRLTNQGVRNIIIGRDFDSERSSKLCLLSFIRCFFEAQIHDDTSLYQQIICRLSRAVDLSDVTMTPLDCMSIGYFMALLLRAGGKVSVHLGHCCINDYSLGLLVGEFSRHAEVCPAGVMQAGVTELDISWNSKITEIGIACVLRTNITNKLNADWCGISNQEMDSLARALAVNSSLEELVISSNNNIGDKGIGHIATALLTNTTLKILNISDCVHTGSRSLQHRSGISDLVAESLARALEVNITLEELNIIDNNISDNGIGHIAKSLQKNKTLKLLNVGTMHTQDNIAGFTDTGVLSLARGVATNTSIECFSIQWSSTDPERTLKMMASTIKNSSLKTLALYIGIHILQPGEAPSVGANAQNVHMAVSPEKAREWYHGVEVGGKELILSLEDSHLKSFEWRVPPCYGCSLQFQTAVDSVNSARHEKGLPNITFSF